MKKTHMLIIRFIIPFLILYGVIVQELGSYLSAQEDSEPQSAVTKAADDGKTFVPNEILVKVRSDANKDQIRAMNKAQGTTIVEMKERLGIARLRVSKPVEEVVAFFQSQPFVEHARPNYILAEIGNEIVTLLDMESFIHEVSPFVRRVYARKEAKEALLRTLVDFKLFSKAAREENLEKTVEVKGNQEGPTEKKLAEVFVGRMMKDVSVSEKEIKAYYETHLEEFYVPEQIKIRQVVVKTEGEAKEIRKEIEAGADLEEIARERLTGGKTQYGIASRWFRRGRLDPAVEQVGFTLRKGEISKVIETSSGYHIVKLEDRRSGRQQSLSEVNNRIRQKLHKQKEIETLERKRAQLKKRYGVRVQPELLSEVKVYTAGGKSQEEFLQMLQEILGPALMGVGTQQKGK